MDGENRKTTIDSGYRLAVVIDGQGVDSYNGMQISKNPLHIHTSDNMAIYYNILWCRLL